MAKILVIDDDDMVRSVVREALTRQDFEVLEAGDGNEGLEVLAREAESLRLVVTDMLMPGREGLETISEIRSLYPGLKVIAMSGGGSARNLSFLRMAETMGAARVLEKPFESKVLVESVREVLGTAP